MKKLFEHPLGAIIPGVLFIIALILAFIAFVAHTQEAEEETDDGCRWHVLNAQGGASDRSGSVNAIQWNDCTGETYHIYTNNAFTTTPTKTEL